MSLYQKIKSAITVRQVGEMYGMEPDRHSMVCCPFHYDSDPSNPDIDVSRSRYNLHLVQPQGRYREEADRMIAATHCRVRKDSVRVVEALVTASPELVGARPLHLAAQDRSVT